MSPSSDETPTDELNARERNVNDAGLILEPRGRLTEEGKACRHLGRACQTTHVFASLGSQWRGIPVTHIDKLLERWREAERAYDAVDPMSDEAARLLLECESARAEYEAAVSAAASSHERAEAHEVLG